MPVSLRRNPPRPGRPRPAGWVVFHPRERDRLPGLAAADFLDLPGEVVSGHADRHVRRVALGGGPAARFAYLKREHRVRWGERLKNALAGFGWASKSRREARVLRELERAGLALAPHWLAYGEDGRGRAFLLVEEVPGGVELRRWLASAPAPRRRALAARLGKGLAALHRHGFDLPDLSAKHVLVDPETLEITLLDWQRARRRVPLPWPRRVSALAALHASTSEALAGPRERARLLCHYLKELRRAGEQALAPADLARAVRWEAEGMLRRRDLREQRLPPLAGEEQRLVWLDGEAVCAIPACAPDLAAPGVARELEPCRTAGAGAGTIDLILPRSATAARLRRRRFGWPWSRLWAALRGRNWRSPELRQARLLFHLPRHGIPAPRLLAFGQRLSVRGGSAFLLTEAREAVPLAEWLARAGRDSRRAVLGEAGGLLRELHRAGCVRDPGIPTGPALVVRLCGARPHVEVGDPAAWALRRTVSAPRVRSDLLRCLRELAPSPTRTDALRFLRGYFRVDHTSPELRRVLRDFLRQTRRRA